MATSTSLSAASCSGGPKISDGINVKVQTVAPSVPATLSLTGSPAQHQQAGTRMVPLLYIQGPPPSMRMGTNVVTTSSGAALNSSVSQKVSGALRPGTALVPAGTQFIPTLTPKLGVTPVISSSPSVPTALVNKTTASMNAGQAQPHFVIQAPRNSGTGAAGTPAIVSTPGKPTITYLGTLIKSNGGKSGEGQIVLPAGQIMQNSNQKLVLANVPLPLTHLTSTSVSPGTNTAGSQHQPSAKVTSLIVPMTIPAQLSSNKGGMINLKITNGQIHAESSVKNSVTYTTLAQVNPGAVSKHAMTPPENDFINTPSNFNFVDEKKKRNQDLNKCLQEAVDAIFSPSSPEGDAKVEGIGNYEKEKIHIKDTGEMNDSVGKMESEEVKEIKVAENEKDMRYINEVNSLRKIGGGREVEDLRETRDLEEAKGKEEIGDLKEVKGMEEAKCLTETIDMKEIKGFKDTSDMREKRDCEEVKGNEEVRDFEDMRDMNELKDKREIKEVTDVREINEVTDVREINEVKDMRENKGVLDVKEIIDDDDEITLIKVLSTKEEPKKEIPDDDVKIEIVTPQVKPSVDHNNDSNSEDFDPMNALDWRDGVGTLPGSEVKFCMNEFGMMEMVDRRGVKKESSGTENSKEDDQCEVISLDEESRPPELEIKKEPKIDERKIKKLRDGKQIHKARTSDDILYCEGCGLYGLESEFVNSRFCSPNCVSSFSRKKAEQTKRERELLQLRLRRRKKRLYQLQQIHKSHLDEDSKTVRKPEKLERTEKKSASPTPLVVTPTPMSEDDNTSNSSNEGTQQPRLPWQMGKGGFSWPKYLEHCKARAAPVKLFKDPFPYTKNGFRVGMKLEGVDPEHPSYFCVLTVSDVQGYRIKLHFDGYSENHDFWVNADSMDIFPPGWCEKNNHTLQPPCGFIQGSFNWASYLKQSKAQTPPRHLFMNRTGNAVCPHGFRLGMKLEAVDRKNSSLVCVATVSDLMDNRILVHFDSWDPMYDYWADPTSPYIHPVGWCEEHGHALTPPHKYRGQPFSWEAYLKETKSVAAPARAFKQRPPCGFRKEMKLECVDKWVPMLIRVSTVIDVVGHQIKIHFDGWPEQYCYWLDDTSPDIHPMGWCQKTGHPLEPPLTWDDAANSGEECPTPGCRGLGHAKGAKFVTHNTVANCPYALQNLAKGSLTPNRLSEKTYSRESVILTGQENIKIEKEEPVPVLDTKPHGRVGRPPKCRRLETMEGNKEQSHDPDWRANDDTNFERKRKKRRNLSKDRSVSPSSTQVSNSSATPPNVRRGPDLEQLQRELLQSILLPGYEPNPNRTTPHLWTKHSLYLNSFVNQHMGTDISQWTHDDVMRFVNSIPGCEDKAKVFSEQQIDGEALLMMAQEDLVNMIGMKLGPAIKLYNSILILRQKVIGASS